uniref:phosphoenolpyruvate carboxykinase (GTP) n=1 Tax=Caenorhabditis japonica TaxID=281687 RepID=A0A8R1HH16_CAEJA
MKGCKEGEKYSKMDETVCPTCYYPSVKVREHRINEACQFIVPRQTNTMIVPGHGHVPVIKGDLSWLSLEVSMFLNECVRLMTPSAIRLCNGSVFEAQELRDVIGYENHSDEQRQLDRFHLMTPDVGYDDVHVITKDRLDAEPENLKLDMGTTSKESFQQSESSEGVDGIRMSSHYISAPNFEFQKGKRFDGCMNGRIMYVVPFSMGCIGSRQSVCGVQVTDDPILVLNLRTTFRVLSSVWDVIASTTNFLRSVHTIGMPRPIIRSIVKNSPPTENSTGSFIVLKHDEQQIWSHGYSFGRTSRFGKTFSVHACSWIGAKKGWLAENGYILAITNPKNVTIYVVYSSLSSVAKITEGLTSGWKIEVMSSQTVWVHWHEGKMYAVAPENDEMAEMHTSENRRNLLNGKAADYQIQSFNPQKTMWNSDLGVPISAYIFANRRSDQFPLILESNKWDEGVVLAAGIRVSAKKHAERDSAESHENLLVECPMLRVDPINFSFAKYINHWLEMGIAVEGMSTEKSEAGQQRLLPPPIFFTNLSQEMEGKVIWPGGVDNARIFEYIFARCTNPADVSNTTSSGLGKVPKSLDLSVLVNLPPLLQINVRFWLQELSRLRAFFKSQMGCCLPPQLDKALTDLAGNV